MTRYRNSGGQRIRVANQRILSCTCCGAFCPCDDASLPDSISVTINFDTHASCPDIDGTYVCDYLGNILFFGFLWQTWEYDDGTVEVIVRAKGTAAACQVNMFANYKPSSPNCSGETDPVFLDVNCEGDLSDCFASSSGLNYDGCMVAEI
jgi:hypothetical protein